MLCGVGGGDVMDSPVDLGKAQLRVVRPSDDLEPIVRFYRDGLGFAMLYEFRDHDGFDEIMLGHPGVGYHLEFTRRHEHQVGKAPTDDKLLVFYVPEREEWERAVRRMEALGHIPVEPANPYWRKQGRTFADPDGYRVVLQNAAWPV